MLQNIKDLQDNNITTVLTHSDKNSLEFNIFHNDTKIAYCVIHFINPVTRKKLEKLVFEIYHDYSDRLAADFADDEEFMQSEIFEELEEVTDFILELI